MLARWEAEDTYRALLRARTPAAPRFVFLDGPPYANGELHAGHALNHVLKDIVVKSRNMAGLLCAFRARVGLPRAAHRAGGGEAAARPEGGPADPLAGRVPRGLPRLRAGVHRHPGRGPQADGQLRALGRALPHARLRLRGAGAPRAGAHRPPGAALPPEEGRVLVHHRPDRARRGRGRVRGPPEPVGLRGLPHRGGHARAAPRAAARVPGRRVPRAAGQGGGPGHLDHHSLDAPRQPGHRGASGARVRLLRPRAAGGGRRQGPALAGAGGDRPGPARGEDGGRGRRRGLGGGAGRAAAHPRRTRPARTSRASPTATPSPTGRGWWSSAST